MCSASNLARLLTKEDMTEYLLGFLKEPYSKDRVEASMGIENLISTYCRGKNYVDVLDGAENLTAIQKRSGILVMRGGDVDWTNESNFFDLCASNKIHDLDVNIEKLFKQA